MASSETSDWLGQAKQSFLRSIALKQQIVTEGGLQPLVAMAQHCADAIQASGKILFCGNGGSAADAQHLAAELTIRLRSAVNRQAIAALPLCADYSSLTACGNDYGFEQIFARMVDALGRPGDVLIGITTSGKSPNVLAAFERAKVLNITCFGFLGGNGGPAKALCDHAFLPASTETARIQEAHITAGHVLMELLEDILLKRGFLSHQ